MRAKLHENENLITQAVAKMGSCTTDHREKARSVGQEEVHLWAFKRFGDRHSFASVLSRTDVRRKDGGKDKIRGTKT